MKDEKKEPNEQTVEETKSYAKPTLTRYGNVETLTAGTTGTRLTDQSSFIGDFQPKK